MTNGPYGPTPGPYDPNAAPLAPSSYGYGGPGAGGPPPDDTMAWVSVASSSLGWLTCCCFPVPFVGLLMVLGGLALALVGTICGYLALQKAKQAGTRTDIAMIGLVLGAVRLGLTVLAIVAVLVMMVLGVGIIGLEGLTHPR